MANRCYWMFSVVLLFPSVTSGTVNTSSPYPIASTVSVITRYPSSTAFTSITTYVASQPLTSETAITSYTTQSTSSVLPSTLPTTLFPQNTFHTLNNVLLVAGVIAAIVVFSLVVLIPILVLVIARVKSKKTVHLESHLSHPGHSNTEGLKLDVNTAFSNEQLNVYNSPPIAMVSTNKSPSDYIYSVGGATQNANEEPQEENLVVTHAELIESNGYVSSHAFAVTLKHTQQPPKQAEDYIDATPTENRAAQSGQSKNSAEDYIDATPRAAQSTNLETSSSHGDATAQFENSTISSKSVSYLNIPVQNETAAGLDSSHQDGMSIVAERKPMKDEGTFMPPANDEWALYAQFKKIKVKLLDQSVIKMSGILGSGQFGTVNRGTWETSNGPLAVAIKILNPERAGIDNNKIKFLREAAIMGQFCHPNVVNLHGIVTEGGTMMMVLELLEKGDLKHYLASKIPNPKSTSSYDGLPQTLLKYCQQVASGMEYLSEKAFIHRDLAARNILVSHNDICKIADFGMARDLEDDTYYISRGGKIPLRWTAPEALEYKKYSSASDVWSFGCVMYEIWSMGEKLYINHSNYNILNVIEGGYRIPPPPGCPRSIYKIMIECWHPSDSNRPSFTSIKQSLLQPDTALLFWTDTNKQVHPQASTIKAPLEAGSRLYEDLQKTYIS